MKISAKTVDSELFRKISEIGGENISACYQCGKCSAGCPSADRMDHIPSLFIRLVQLGMDDAVRASNTPWVCLTCFVCTVRCPQGIDIAGIMESARLLKSRESVDHFSVRSLGDNLEDNLPPIAVVSCFRKHTAS